MTPSPFRVSTLRRAFILLAMSLVAPRVPLAEDPPPIRHMLMLTPNLSAEAGADDLLTAYYGATYLEDEVLRRRFWEEDGFLGKTGGILYRLSKMVFLDDPIPAFYASVGQHEIFGHGFRAREFDFTSIAMNSALLPRTHTDTDLPRSRPTRNIRLTMLFWP